MTRILKELYRKIATFGGAVALMVVTTGAGYEEMNWGKVWMPSSIQATTSAPAPLVPTCENQQGDWIAPLKLASDQQWCQLSTQAERGELDSEKTENIF